MRIVNILGSKGGVGTSTAAAIIAIGLAHAGERVALVDLTGTGDLGAILGSDLDNITTCTTVPDTNNDQYDFAIIDHPTATTRPEPAGTNILVVTNCYLSVLRATKLAWRPDAVVVVTEHQRALNVADITAALGTPQTRMLVIAHDPLIARVVDAGLLADRFPAQLRRTHPARFIYDITLHTANN